MTTTAIETPRTVVVHGDITTNAVTAWNVFTHTFEYAVDPHYPPPSVGQVFPRSS